MVEPKLFYSGFLLSPWIDIDENILHLIFQEHGVKNKSGDPIFKNLQ